MSTSTSGKRVPEVTEDNLPEVEFDKVDLFGVPLARVTFEEALDALKQVAEDPQPTHVVTADATMIVAAQEDLALKQLLQQADLVVPDGTGALWAAARLGTPLQERVPGCDLAERLCVELADSSCKFYFLGGAPGIAALAAERMRRRYPTLRVVGTRHGYFSSEEEAAVVAEISALRPNVLFCALGIPKQEFFLARHKAELGANLLMGVGGTLDILSGAVKRAGPVWQQLNIEWLYRTLKEPRKRLPRALKLLKLVKMTIDVRRARRKELRERSQDG